MKHLSLISLSQFLSLGLLMLFCNLPNPAENPRYADVKLSIDNGVIHKGDTPQIGIAVYFTQRFYKVSLTTSCNVFDTSFATDSLEDYDTVYFNPRFEITGPCTLFVNAQYKDGGLRDKCDTLPFYVLSTLNEDTVPPVVTIKSPSANNSRVQSLPLIIQLACSDENGIDLVQSVFKGEKYAVSKSHDSLYSVEITALTAGKCDTIYFTVTDSSIKHNAAIFQVLVNYNCPPSAISVSSPAINATGVTRTPAFTWSGGFDPDEDSVFYRVQYGTAAEVLTSQTAVFNASPVTVPATTVLEPKTTYYWQLIAWTNVFNDTVRSDVMSFTTTGTGPAIAEHPQNQQVRAGQKALFTVSATGTDLLYQWQKNGTAIPGATSPTCTTAQVSAADNETAFRCMIYNTLDTVFSNDAVLAILHTITYNANGATGNVPADTNGYLSGSSAIIKSNVDVTDGTPVSITGHTFGGWSTNSTGSGKIYRGDGTDTLKMPLAPVTLYAKWVIDTFTVTLISSGSTTFQTQRITYNGQATLPATQPVLDGNAFEGWFTTNDATGAAFDFSLPVTANRTLYAKWTAVYSVTYHASGGNGSVPADSKKYKNGESVTVSGNTTGLTKTDNEFSGWTLNAQGMGTVYNAGDKISIESANVNLYAKWQPIFVITFDVQGATTAAKPTIVKIDTGTAIVSLPIEPIKTGYHFDGWYTGINGKGSKVTASTIFISNETVYAKWLIKDIDNNTYTEVKIGNQVWMVENLKTTKYNDGTEIPNIDKSSEWSGLTTGAYCWFSHSLFWKDNYGAYYNWYAVQTDKLAPKGWHIPSDSEWKTLEEHLIVNGYNYDETTVDNKIAKSLATNDSQPLFTWSASTVEGTIGNDISKNNKTGFTALPAGYCSGVAAFYHADSSANWWSSSFYDNDFSWSRSLYHNIVDLESSASHNKMGYNVRCIRDY